MTEVDPEVMKRINELARQRIASQERREARIKEFTDVEAGRKASLERDLLALDEEDKLLDDEIFTLIEQHRPSLIERGKQSFSTLWAVFQFQKTGPTTEVADAEMVMTIARRHGQIKYVANPPSTRRWKFSAKKFKDFLKKGPQIKALYRAALVEAPGGETLSMRPNSAYLEKHGKDRLTPKSIQIKKRG